MQRATTTFATGQRVVAQGQELPDSDPLVVAHPDLFEQVPEKPKRSARRKRTGDGDADGDT